MAQDSSLKQLYSPFPFSKKTLVELYPALIKIFDKEKIVRIASYDGASHALAAVFTHTPALIELGFLINQIVRIASNNG